MIILKVQIYINTSDHSLRKLLFPNTRTFSQSKVLLFQLIDTNTASPCFPSANKSTKGDSYHPQSPQSNTPGLNFKKSLEPIKLGNYEKRIRIFTPEDRLGIIQEAQREGATIYIGL